MRSTAPTSPPSLPARSEAPRPHLPPPPSPQRPAPRDDERDGDDGESPGAAAGAVVIRSEQLGILHPLQKISKPFSLGGDDFFPFLLCNVGTGVSILHVVSERSYTRVSGTAVGGGTFLGLTRLLTRARRFQEALDVAASGDARRVDMLVDDIYGGEKVRAAPGLGRS